MALRIPSSPYSPYQGDVWELAPSETDAELLEIPLPDMEPVPSYSQTVTVQPISFFNNRVGFVSEYYKNLLGYASAVGTHDAGDLIIHQLISHFPLFDRFTMSTNVPIKQARINGILVSQTYLNQVQGFFNFEVNGVAGFEALYALPAGSVVTITDIVPFGTGG